MKRCSWFYGILSMVLCAALLFSACGVAAAQQGSEAGSLAPQSDEMDSSETLKISSEERQVYLQSLNIDSAPVDLSDLKAVTAVYVSPLPNKCYLYGWESPSEITADNLIEACAKNNFLNLPRDDEECYLPESAHPLADDVEAAIQKHFDVEANSLRKSKWYENENGKEHTYSLVSGFGGGWGAVAVSAEQMGNQIKIGIAIEKGEDESITPVGTMTVELTEDNVVQYISYEYTNFSFSF